MDQTERDRLVRLEEREKQNEKEIKVLSEEIGKIRAQINTAKGGFWVLLFIGSLIGATLNFVKEWVLQ
jgi:cell division protein FtsB